MPSLGADMEAGTLVEWLVKPGDRVKRGDVVAVVETQKGAIEIEIFETGEIEQILVDLGTKVPVGTPLARIRTEQEVQSGRCNTSRVAPRSRQPCRQPDFRRSSDSGLPSRQHRAARRSARLRASPAARRLAQEHATSISRRSQAAAPPARSSTLMSSAASALPPHAGCEKKRATGPRSRRHANGDCRRHGTFEAGNPTLLSRASGRRDAMRSNGLRARMRRVRLTTAC